MYLEDYDWRVFIIFWVFLGRGDVCFVLFCNAFTLIQYLWFWVSICCSSCVRCLKCHLRSVPISTLLKYFTFPPLSLLKLAVGKQPVTPVHSALSADIGSTQRNYPSPQQETRALNPTWRKTKCLSWERNSSTSLWYVACLWRECPWKSFRTDLKMRAEILLLLAAF